MCCVVELCCYPLLLTSIDAQVLCLFLSASRFRQVIKAYPQELADELQANYTQLAKTQFQPMSQVTAQLAASTTSNAPIKRWGLLYTKLIEANLQRMPGLEAQYWRLTSAINQRVQQHQQASEQSSGDENSCQEQGRTRKDDAGRDGRGVEIADGKGIQTLAVTGPGARSPHQQQLCARVGNGPDPVSRAKPVGKAGVSSAGTSYEENGEAVHRGLAGGEDDKGLRQVARGGRGKLEEDVAGLSEKMNTVLGEMRVLSSVCVSMRVSCSCAD